mmetsp:Transcript_13764/g.28140  ORF Transcript_13764/g.28140 Transcript_13764/m.28140 type:complete len:225 (-) Transcript_13764:3288-3962(-)
MYDPGIVAGTSPHPSDTVNLSVPRSEISSLGLNRQFYLGVQEPLGPTVLDGSVCLRQPSLVDLLLQPDPKLGVLELELFHLDTGLLHEHLLLQSLQPPPVVLGVHALVVALGVRKTRYRVDTAIFALPLLPPAGATKHSKVVSPRRRAGRPFNDYSPSGACCQSASSLLNVIKDNFFYIVVVLLDLHCVRSCLAPRCHQVPSHDPKVDSATIFPSVNPECFQIR